MTKKSDKTLKEATLMQSVLYTVIILTLLNISARFAVREAIEGTGF